MTDNRLKIAAIITIYHTCSHADAIVSKFIKGMSVDDGFYQPDVRLASVYLDQVLDNDIGVSLCRENGITIYPTIRQALCCGESQLNVDGILHIGEHGDYATDEKGRRLYPRRHFFEQICGNLGQYNKTIPVYIDKHFSYDTQDTLWMWNRAKELGVPLMAGSCLPLAWRNPWLEHPVGTELDEALAIGFGNIEAYGFHAAEILQCMSERRHNGETGIRSVQCLEGDEVWRARDKGIWPGDLAEAACARISDKEEGSMEEKAKTPAVFLVEYNDGFKGFVLMLHGYVQSWAYAARTSGGVSSCEFYLQPEGPAASFGYLCLNIQKFFKTGKPPYPAERTLLTSGLINMAIISRHKNHRKVETPFLNIRYKPYEKEPIRPKTTRPKGASLNRDAPDILIPYES